MRVLSIDGGGIRGLIPVLVLAEIEQRTGRRIAELFDLIAGTSTGGILACALARPADGAPPGAPRTAPHFAAAEIAALYEREGPRIFHRDLLRRVRSVNGWIDERYASDGLVAVLGEYLGDTRISQALTPVLVTAYDLEQRSAFFFRTQRAAVDGGQDFRMADAAHATSAAPTYFEPALVTDAAGAKSYALVDGGVFAINPAMCAYAELAHAGQASSIELLLSLGTGSHTRPIALSDARGWGQLQWARPILDVVFDGVADTVDFQLAQLLGADGYVRLQTRLDDASDDMDDASAENLAALRREAERLIAAADATIDAVCARLT